MSFLKHALSYFYPELRASIENPSVPLSAYDQDVVTPGGVWIDEGKALSIGAVHACVKVISETMAQMDLEVLEKVGKAYRPNTNHPNYWLLHAQPSPNYNRFEFIQGIMSYALLWGNGYAKIVRDRFATAKELKIIPSWEITPKMTERGKLYYEWRQAASTEIIFAEDMIHLKNLGTDGLIGLSPIAIQRNSLQTSVNKMDHESAFYKNGARASGVLMTPGTLGAKERQNLTTSFEKEQSGARNRFKTIVLEEGVKYQQLTIPQNDAQFLESKKYDRSEIAGWYRVPPYKIGDHEKSTYSNIEGQERSFAKDTIVPWAERLQQELDRKLFFDNERGKFYAKFNLDDLIKGDIETRYRVYKMGVENGLLTPLEVREAEGWGTEGHEELNQFFMNGAMKAVRQILTENVNQNAN